MDSKILSYADEVLTFDRKCSRQGVFTFLAAVYGESDEVIDAVISVLEGEGYFDV